MEVSYKVLSEVRPSERLTRLYRELTGTEMIPDIGRINAIIASGSLAFYTAWLDGGLVGMCSVIPCRTSLADKLCIEDVAVLGECRGLGVGKGLVTYAMEDAPKRFFPGPFWLTSNPSRTAARKMYASLGFKEYETGVFFRD